MHGQICVDSEPGRGSEFLFTVSLAVAQGMVTAGPASFLPGLSILIVDDHPLAREILTRTCSSFGWQTRALASGAAALSELAEGAAAGRSYDILLLDWRMPDMDGLEMLARAEVTVPQALPCVILMTTAAEIEAAAAASDAVHLDAIISKPVTPSSLFDAVTRACSGERIGYLPAPANTDQRLAGMRLLVAEDNELNQQVITQLLAQAGAEIQIAANGQAAVDTLRQDARFDAVLMDIQMPVLDGYSAARIIREQLQLVDLPIIAVTAHAMPEDREKSRRAGMCGHIAKPIDIQDLLDVLAREHSQSLARADDAARSAAMARDGEIVFPGIDLASARYAFGADMTQYVALLRQFVARHGEDPARAGRLAAAGEPAEACKLMHDMRGVAGFMRATGIAGLATQCETLLAAGRNDEAAPLLTELHAAIAALQSLIEHFEASALST
jgi:CheY-like chemotaxis protein